MNYSFIIHTMYLPSSKYHFDTMFVILCVIARATSHSIPDTSKSSNNQLNNQYRASFMDFILDANLIEHLHSSSNLINKDLAYSYSSSHKATLTASTHQQSQTVCAHFTNYLSGNQMRLCHDHLDIFKIVLPAVLQMTLVECRSITSDLKWNCPSIENYLNRSSVLAYTREGALVRSIFNASIMYLVLKTCITSNHLSCGCLDNQRFTHNGVAKITNVLHKFVDDAHKSHRFNATIVFKQEPGVSELSKLDSGSVIHNSKVTPRRQGCTANVAFARAFTKILIESDDIKALKKASKVLNMDYNYNNANNVSSKVKYIDFDHKDLAYKKWSKAAINIHNNNVGRELVRHAIHKRCRCHGLSGACQYQTCWDNLHDFSSIASSLRNIYMFNSSEALIENHGSFDKPDLQIARKNRNFHPPLKSNTMLDIMSSLISWTELSSLLLDSTKSFNTQSKNGGLLYLNESPDYCEPLHAIKFLGTKGRACALMNNITDHTNTSKKNSKSAVELTEEAGYNQSTYNSPSGAPGSCKGLCCNRGYHSELVLDMVACNCRFKYCCKVDCEHCLQQRVQHFCL